MPRPTEYRVSWHFTLRKDKIQTLVEKINFLKMVLLFVFFFCKIRSDIPISVKTILTRLLAKQSHGGKVIVWE